MMYFYSWMFLVILGVTAYLCVVILYDVILEFVSHLRFKEVRYPYIKANVDVE